jgi:hypothetical protein
MTGEKQLSERQLAVIDDIFDGELQEQALLEKHKLSRRLFNKWLADGAFTGHCDRRIAWEHRRCELMLARYAPSAAATLVGLTECEQSETARKACLDIISMQPADRSATAEVGNNAESPAELPPETAGKILAVLAEQQ